MEVALAFFKACGAYLQDVNNQGYQRWAQHSFCTFLDSHMLCGKLKGTVRYKNIGKGWHCREAPQFRPIR